MDHLAWRRGASGAAGGCGGRRDRAARCGILDGNDERPF
jgi:hypothetical protein